QRGSPPKTPAMRQRTRRSGPSWRALAWNEWPGVSPNEGNLRMTLQSTPESQFSATNSSTDLSRWRREFWLEKLSRHPDDPYAWSMVHRTVFGAPPIHLPY